MDLWSAADERAVSACRCALSDGDLAAALLAVDGASPLRAAETRAQLAAWADEVAERKPGPAADARATALRVVLGGLSGDDRDYYDPRNASLTEVVDRGHGMPIILSAIWMVVGRGAGIPVEGVGMPGHFVVRVCGPRPVIADPFRAGRTLALPECRAMVTKLTAGQLAWRDAWLDTTPVEELVHRVLRNLALCYTRSGDDVLRFRATRFVCELDPGSVRAALMHAHTCDEIGLGPIAVQRYREVATRFPDTDEARWAIQRADEIAEDAPPVH